MLHISRYFLTSWVWVLSFLAVVLGGTGVSRAEYPASAHPYTNNLDQTWTYTLAGNPATIAVTFDTQTQVETDYDKIYVMDAGGNNIPGSPFTGTALAGKTVRVPGNTVQIRLTTDISIIGWGFAVTQVAEDNINNAPVVPDKSVKTNKNKAATIVLTGKDADGDTLTYSIETPPSYGTVTLNGSTATYMPGTGYTGSDNFTYKANDGLADSNVATVTITVLENTAPVASAKSIGVKKNVVAAIALTATDANGDTLTYAIVTPPSYGTVTLNGSTATYTPGTDYTGSDSFTYKANDGQVDSNVATVTLTVSNTAPTVSNLSVGTSVNLAKDIMLSGNNPNGESLTFSLVTQPTHGSAVLNGTIVTYTPATNYVGTDSFTYQARDGLTNTGIATVTIMISPPGAGTSASPYLISELAHLAWMADTVSASAGKYYTLTADINASATSTWNNGQGFVPIGGEDAGPFCGIFDGDGHTITGLVINRPSASFVGLFGFIDSNSVVRDIGLVNCSVTGGQYVGGLIGFNYCGTVSAAYSTGGEVTGGPYDVGGLIGQNSYGTVSKVYAGGNVAGGSYVGGLVGNNQAGTISNAYATGGVFGSALFAGGLVGTNTGTITNTCAIGSVAGGSNSGGLIGAGSGTVTSSYWDIQISQIPVSPGGGTGKTTIQMVIQSTYVGWNFINIWTMIEDETSPQLAPVACDKSVWMYNDQPVDIVLTATNFNADTLTYTIVTQPTFGTVTLIGSTATYTPAPYFPGTDSFTYAANNGAEATVTIEMNTRPDAYGVSSATLMNRANTITLEAWDRDNDTLTYSIVTPPLHGTATLGNYGEVAYTPASGYVGTDSFTYKVNDGVVDSNIATVTIAVVSELLTGDGWVKTGTGVGFGSGKAVAAFPDGSYVVVGSFENTLTLNPAGATPTVLTNGAFIVRYAWDGTLVWAKRVGGTLYGGDGYSVCVCPGGETFLVTGYADNPAEGYTGCFIAKYNTADGSRVWVKDPGMNSSCPMDVSVFSDGSSVIAGYFSGTIKPGLGETNETTLTSVGGDDVLVAKYNADGTLAWARRTGGTSSDSAKDIAVFSDGSCVVTGLFYSPTIVFGQGEANQTTLTFVGGSELFLARYNPDGTLAWAKGIGGTSYDYGNKVCVSPNDQSFYVVGQFYDSTAGWLTLAKCNAGDGSLVWGKHVGNYTYGVSVLSDGSPVTTGMFYGTNVFGSGEANQTVLTTTGGYNMFLAKHSPEGTLVWARQAGGPDDTRGNDVSVFSDGSLVVTGSFVVQATFGAGETYATTVTGMGDTDVFTAKFNPDGTLASATPSVPGDVNGDHLANVSDVDALLAAIKAGSMDLAFDVDDNGSVGTTDMDVLIRTILNTEYGDANLDRVVDVGDLGILAAGYGSTGKSWGTGDFNGDGVVDVGDLGILAANYGAGSAKALDLSADYAKVFGLKIAGGSEVVSDDSADEDSTEALLTSPCNSLGLPLIALLFLASLLPVKLDK